MPSPEILAVLADEVADAAGKMAAALTEYAGDGPEGAAKAADRYREPVRRLAATSELLRLTGLQALCTHIEANVAALNGRAIDPVLRGLLDKWPTLVVGYLRAPQDGVYSRELADQLRHGAWPIPLGADDALDLGRQLATLADTMDDDTGQPTRPVTAQPEDVVLVLPADVNPALVESFLVEAPLQAGAYTSLVEQVIRGAAGPETMNEARRLVHSIKGAANTIGVRGIGQLTHHLEDLLEYLARRSITPAGRLAKLLMDAADCLETMIEALTDGEPAPAQAQGVLQRLLDTANAIDRGEAIESLENTGAAAPPTAMPEAAGTAAAAAANAPRPVPAPQPPVPQAPPDVKHTVRVAAASIDEMLRLSGEMTIGRSHIEERLHQALAQAAELREQHGLLQQRAADLDRLVTVRGVAAGQKHGAEDGSRLFDALELDQYGELHGAVHGLLETATDAQTAGDRALDALTAIETAVTQQGLVNVELHEQIMRARMVPASAMEPRLARTVRQVCEATGKRARLELRGADVMLDDHVVHDLINPLVHLLRNAVDHGLEPPGQRELLGKPADGTVRLSFAREGNHIVICCEDDGAGLDLARIHSVAVQRGLVAGDARLGDAEIARLVLLPGFSTSGSVSEISGRGVGMDIVNTAVRKLNGAIDIRTVAGKETRFILRLPLTLGTAHCLLVRSADVLAAIPTDALDRVVHAGAQHIEGFDKNMIFRENRERIAVHELADLLGYPTEHPLGRADDRRPVVVVNDAEGKRAVVVDSLVAGRELVIKRLGRFLAGTAGVAGASLLGDGRVVPVLNLQELLHLRRENGGVLQPRSVRTAAAAPPAFTEILVVDDSLSMRQALTELLEGEGYQVRTARDGIEALEYLARERPAAVLVDLEMPRMNGLELTQRLREREETRGLPVIMVTSRTSEKHRTQAQIAGVDLYLTKPYREMDLLASLRSMLDKAA